FALLMTATFFCQAQTKIPIIIDGQAIDALTHRPVKPLQIINLTNIQRTYGDSSGNFIIEAGKNDSLVFISRGYETTYLCYKDSLLQKIYTLTIRLNKVTVELPEVIVQSQRDFEQVHKDAQSLGYNKNDYMVHGMEILQSPFTYLYQLFSTREKDIRGYAELENEGKKKQLIKELVNNYMSLGILKLDPSEVDNFVDYIEVPDDFLKTVDEYDFISYLQFQADRFHHRVLPSIQNH
ncbi:MAG: hypothetical protein ACHQD9_00260, partial [Chitinophagales bacterium]